MKPPPDINPHVAPKVLKVFLDSDLRYQLNGTPHCEYIEQQSRKYHGQTRRVLLQVAGLGEDGARKWMDFFIGGMSDDGN